MDIINILTHRAQRLAEPSSDPSWNGDREEVEHEFGMHFPDEFYDFHQALIGMKIPFSGIFSLCKDADSSIYGRNNQLITDGILAPNYVAFAFDGTIDYYCFSKKTSNSIWRIRASASAPERRPTKESPNFLAWLCDYIDVLEER